MLLKVYRRDPLTKSCHGPRSRPDNAARPLHQDLTYDQRHLSLRLSWLVVCLNARARHGLQLQGLPPLRNPLGLWPRGRRHPVVRPDGGLPPRRRRQGLGLSLLPFMRLRWILARGLARRGRTIPRRRKYAPRREPRADFRGGYSPFRRIWLVQDIAGRRPLRKGYVVLKQSEPAFGTQRRLLRGPIRRSTTRARLSLARQRLMSPRKKCAYEALA